jgi:HAD superfamily hydrolase (TIGR01549 family)
VTLTLLIDLDNTLLDNHMDTFIPAYLGALGEYLASHTPPEHMVRVMMAATQQMFENNNPNRTLKETFDSHFYAPLGLVETEMRSYFEYFYLHIFPTLKKLTRKRPEAVKLVQDAIARGYQIGIATNPLFPRIAIDQRLAWAGLGENEATFRLIPSYEDFHFAKPNPAYFAEFLGRMGWPEGPVVMIGDDLGPDIKGARSFGLPVFWISEGDEKIPEGHPLPTRSGMLTDVLPWLDSTLEEELIPDFSSPIAMVATLRGSSAALQGMLAEIQESKWTERPHPTEWCLTEVICHLRDVEREVNLPRMQKIITETNPFIPGVDSDTWALERAYISQDGPQALQDFIAARIETLALLESLNPLDWDRPVRHAIFGPTELKEIISIMAGHERLHGRQVSKVLKKQRGP